MGEAYWPKGELVTKLEARVRKALADPALKIVFSDLPKSFHDNPAALRRLLIDVAQGFPLANSGAYREAHAALSELQDARDLRAERGRKKM